LPPGPDCGIVVRGKVCSPPFEGSAVSPTRLTKIGKYEVECLVGEGAMGVVYRAVDPMINRRVAIKVMSDAVAQNASLRERFLREAQAAGSLQHPNVVTIYDFGEVDDHLFIAMEYVEGDDLSELLGRKVPIPLGEAIELVIGILQGLAFAHKRGIVHRDIKPANIRVDLDGRARLMDFGVAHVASSEMTSTGALMGTPSYMAPEQITGGTVTPVTDIFSVGVVLYELLAHNRPFEGDRLQTVMYQILNTAPRPLNNWGRGVPPELNRIVMRALEKDPKLRYQSALAMASDLAKLRNTIDPNGTSSSLSLRQTIDVALAREDAGRRKRTRRRQATQAAAGVFAVALVALGARAIAHAGRSSAVHEITSNASLAPSEPDAADSTPSAPPRVAVAPTPAVSRAPAPAVEHTVAGPAAPAANPRTTTPKPVSERTAAQPRRVVEKAAPVTQRVEAPPPERSGPAVSDLKVPAPTLHVASPSTRSTVVAPQQAESPVAAPPPVAAPRESRENTSSAIAAVIAAYGRALEARDIAELRRVYPSMTADQARAFDDLFHATRSLQVSLSVTSLQVDGNSADAQVSGTYAFVNTRGETERQPMSFHATLRRDGNAWALTAIR